MSCCVLHSEKRRHYGLVAAVFSDCLFYLLRYNLPNVQNPLTAGFDLQQMLKFDWCKVFLKMKKVLRTLLSLISDVGNPTV